MPSVAETFANSFTEKRLESLKLKSSTLGFAEEGGDHEGGEHEGGEHEGDHGEMHFHDGETNEREHGDDGGDHGEMHFHDGETNERGGDIELRDNAFPSVEVPVGRLSVNDLLNIRNERLLSVRK